MNRNSIPELQALQSPKGIVRIPPEMDVPVTPRVMRLIDSTPFQRLKQISQLGLVRHVYPGATHSRFEHSLGVYRNGLLFLQRLCSLSGFTDSISDSDTELLIVAGLLHDLGHWPFCHAIEDMRLDGVARHEKLARHFLFERELSKCISEDWNIRVDALAELLAPTEKASPRYPLLGSILSGPIDIDKLDYLDRDSLHAGVPYGRNFDRNRLISQLCIGSDGKSLAITDKARTAAEMMIFARYVMFSEVYWHHAVRSATSMLQRIVWELLKNSQGHTRLDGPDLTNAWQHMNEPEFISQLRETARSSKIESMVEGLFGARRSLYKRIAEFHSLQSPTLHAALARRPYATLVELGDRLAEYLSQKASLSIEPIEILIDAPPEKLEVQFDVQIRQDSGRFLSLGELSPVASTLANQQFDSLVKRVRIFAAPHLREALRTIDISNALQEIMG